MSMLIEIRAMMNDCIFFPISDGKKIQAIVFTLQEEFNLLEFSRWKEDLLLVFVFRHLIIIDQLPESLAYTKKMEIRNNDLRIYFR